MRVLLKKWFERIRWWNFNPVERKSKKHTGADVRCPSCHGWLSVTSQTTVPKFTSTDFGFAYECGRCETKSYWNCVIAPVAIRCDEKGLPKQ